MDEKAKAYRKWQALRNMTVARGCTTHEAEVAKKLASLLAAKWGFADAPPKPFREDFYARWARAAARAGARWNWEYRRCGKSNCWCARGGDGHGPYKYSKVREGKHVRSIYRGK